MRWQVAELSCQLALIVLYLRFAWRHRKPLFREWEPKIDFSDYVRKLLKQTDKHLHRMRSEKPIKRALQLDTVQPINQSINQSTNHQPIMRQ